MRYCL